MNFVKFIIFSIFLFVAQGVFFAQASDKNSWKTIKQDHDNAIEVYYRRLVSGNIEFKGITFINSSLSSIIALFDDVNMMPKWVYRTDEVIVLKEIGDKEAYAYTIHNMPFPLKKRDSIVHTIIDQNPNDLSVTIRGKAVPDYIPIKEDFVRIVDVKSFWKFIPVDNKGKIKVIFQGYGDPGGGIVSSIYHSPLFNWLCKMFLWKLPYITLQNMKKMVKMEKYQMKSFDYIKEKNFDKD